MPTRDPYPLPEGVLPYPFCEAVSGNLVIPDEYDGEPVSAIDAMVLRVCYEAGVREPWFRDLALHGDDARLREAFDQLLQDARYAVIPTIASSRHGRNVPEKVLRRWAGRAIDIRTRRAEGRPAAFYGLPTYFRACCVTAREGGATGYDEAGYHLAINVATHDADLAEIGEWDEQVAHLCALLDADDLAGAWAWFADLMPRCAAEVPKKRQDTFLRGVLRAHAAGRIQ